MKLSKTTTLLLIVLAVLVIFVWLLQQLEGEPTSFSATQAMKPLLQREVDLEKLQPRLRAIYLADQIEDPVERCLNFPTVEGIEQTSELIEFYCKSISNKRSYAELTQLLDSAKFEEIDHLIDLALSNYLENGVDESGPYRVFDLFYYQSNWSKRIASEWIKARPNSPAALVVQADVIGNQAGIVLQGRAMSRLTDEEKDQYKELTKQENQILERAIELNSSFLPAIDRRLRNTTYEKDEVAISYLNMGLEVDPNSYFIRNSFLHRLLPQWHGSFEEMDAFTNEAMVYLDKNPRLIFLKSKRYAELGRREWAQGNFEEALEIYDEFLNIAPSTSTWDTTAAVYKDLGDKLSEFERLSQATRFAGYYPYVEQKRVHLLTEFSEWQWAEELALSSIETYPNHNGFYASLGWLYKKDLRFEDAISMHKKTLEVDPENVYAHTEIAWIHTYRTRNLELAKPHIDALLEIDPGDYHAWLYMSDYHHETGGDPLFNALENFLKFVDRNDPDMKQSINTIESFMKTHLDGTE